MKEPATKVIRKVSLEIIYDAIEERTREIKEEIGDFKQKEEEDFRYLNQKIDSQTGQVRQEISQVRQEIGQINQRLDTVMQMMVDINKQIVVNYPSRKTSPTVPFIT